MNKTPVQYEEVTVIRRPHAKTNTDGASLAINLKNGEALVIWPQSGVGRYVNGTIAPCRMNGQQLSSIIEDLHLSKLEWKQMGDHERATSELPVGKIAASCGVKR
jgi:hypothetical protein